MNNTQMRKLQNFLDAEKAGLLIKLPCPIGTRVYRIVSMDEYLKVMGCCVCIPISDNDTVCTYFDKDEPDGEICAISGQNVIVRDIEYRLISCRFTYEMIPEVDKYVFINSSDAWEVFITKRFAKEVLNWNDPRK